MNNVHCVLKNKIISKFIYMYLLITPPVHHSLVLFYLLFPRYRWNILYKKNLSMMHLVIPLFLNKHSFKHFAVYLKLHISNFTPWKLKHLRKTKFWKKFHVVHRNIYCNFPLFQIYRICDLISTKPENENCGLWLIFPLMQ